MFLFLRISFFQILHLLFICMCPSNCSIIKKHVIFVFLLLFTTYEGRSNFVYSCEGESGYEYFQPNKHDVITHPDGSVERVHTKHIASSPYPVLSQYISFYEVKRDIKTIQSLFKSNKTATKEK